MILRSYLHICRYANGPSIEHRKRAEIGYINIWLALETYEYVYLLELATMAFFLKCWS